MSDFKLNALLIAVVLLIIACVAAFHPAKADETTDLTNQLNDLKAEYATLQADRATLAKRKDDLLWSKQQVDKQVAEFNEANRVLQQKASSYDSEVRYHDSWCPKESPDQNLVNRCNSDADRLDAEKAQLQQEAADLQQRSQLLDEAVNTQNEQSTKVWNQDKADYDRMVTIYNAELRIVAELRAISQGNDSCKKAIQDFDSGNGSAENMKAVCGSMFDGN